MKIYKTQQEIEKDIKDGELIIKGDVKFECSFTIPASIKVVNGNIVDGWGINANNINANNINALNINAHDINAYNIKVNNIKANNINAYDINAHDINAHDISYYAFCCVYQSIKCFSIKSKREKAQEPICLEGKLEIEEKANYQQTHLSN